MSGFKLKAKPTFKAKVKIHVPGEEPGEIEFEFRHRTRDELKAFLAKADRRKPEDVILDLAVGWDAEGEFARGSITELVQQFHGADAAVLQRYIDELLGQRLGN